MNYVLVALYAGLISVDRFAALNLMISRPIAIAFVMGLLLGNPHECFYIGLVFEAVGLIDVPFGTRIPKEDSFGAFAACVLFAILPLDHADEFAICFLLTILCMFPVTLTCSLTRTLNQKLFLRQHHRHNVKPGLLLFYGVLFAFLRGVIVYGLGTAFIYSFYKFIHGHIDGRVSFFLFSLMIFTFLSGYIVRFLSVKSSVKYAIFACGLAVGWLIL